MIHKGPDRFDGLGVRGPSQARGKGGGTPLVSASTLALHMVCWRKSKVEATRARGGGRRR